MSINNVTVFHGLPASGSINGVANIPGGTRILQIINITDGSVGSGFAPFTPADNQIVQETSTDLSAKTFLAFY